MDRCYYLAKHRVELESLIGASFGSMMELDKEGKRLVPVCLSEEEMFELTDLDSECEVMPEENDCKDNRNLIDDHGASQRLTMEEIECLKNQASSDKEIIDNLCANSSTFADKSAFSQAKYIKKKKQKYTNYFRVYKPSVRLLCEMMFQQQNPAKPTSLRLDTLSQLMGCCNIRSGGHFIVVDNHSGLLAAAVIERLIGDGIAFPEDKDPGLCIQMYLEQGPTAKWRSCIEALNLPLPILSRVLLSYQIHQASNLLNQQNEMTSDPDPASAAAGPLPEPCPLPSNGHSADGDKDDVVEAKRRKLDEKMVAKDKRRAERRVEEGKAREILSRKMIDGFILMSRQFDPCLPAQVLMQFLAPSAPFAIYSPLSEPLAKCMLLLKPNAVNLRLSDTWLRHYQVLPGRTRPHMNMSNAGGFILTGTKIIE